MATQWLNLALSGQGSCSDCGQGTKIPPSVAKKVNIIYWAETHTKTQKCSLGVGNNQLCESPGETNNYTHQAEDIQTQTLRPESAEIKH